MTTSVLLWMATPEDAVAWVNAHHMAGCLTQIVTEKRRDGCWILFAHMPNNTLAALNARYPSTRFFT